MIIKKLNEFKKFFLSLELFPSVEPHVMPFVNANQDGKIVYLMRHGQSEFNRRRREAFTKFKLSDLFTYDYNIKDAPLSPIGIQQALNISTLSKPIYTTETIDKIFVSPLTRAIQTATLSFPQLIEKGFEANHLLSEARHTTCDLALPISELKINFPHVDFTQVDTNDLCFTTPIEKSGRYLIPIENIESVNTRCIEFTNFLLHQKGKSFIVVGHSIFFKQLTQSEVKLRNCEIGAFRLHSDGRWECLSRDSE